MKTLKLVINKAKTMPARPESPVPQLLSWLFSMGIMFTFIYVCEVTGM